MFDDEVREQIFAKSELQKIDLMTLSLVIKAIEEVLEGKEDEQSLSGTRYFDRQYVTCIEGRNKKPLCWIDYNILSAQRINT